MSKIILDQNLCIGCAVCNAIAPTIFDINDEGIAYLLKDEAENVDSVASCCPSGAITIQ